MLGITSPHVIFFISLNYVYSCNYTEKLTELKIIPDIIPTPPSHTCRVAYRIGEKRREISSGELLLHKDIKIRPKLKWPTSEGKFYTLYLTGVSFVDRRTLQEDFGELTNIATQSPILTRERECWTVINIPGNNIELGDEVFVYKPTQIDMFNVTEYMIFLVYEQAVKYSRMGVKDNYPRSPNVKRLIYKYQLLDNPWAGNFFTIFT